MAEVRGCLVSLRSYSMPSPFDSAQYTLEGRMFVGYQTDALTPWAYRGFSMKPTLRPKADPLPDCVYGPAEMPKLDPRPMPALPLACPAPQDYRMPLWRKF